MIRTLIFSSKGSPGLAFFLFTIYCFILTPNTTHPAELKHLESPQTYVLEAFKQNNLVFLGTTHRKTPILKFIMDLIPHLKVVGATHVALEIPTDQQDNLDKFMNTGSGLSGIYVHPQIDCLEYRALLTKLHILDRDDKPAVVALDLPKSKYGGKISRDEWMAKSIAGVFNKDPETKMLVVVGNNHVLKNLDWQDHVPNKTGSIREYLDRLLPSRKAFSIGQIIDEVPNNCDFTKEFGPMKGAVAFDCDNEKFKDWKISVTSAIAIKDTKPCDLFDGLIVY
jgi:hypothetical protein